MCKEPILHDLDHVTKSNNTFLGAALELLRTKGFTMERPGVPNIAIVITDGLSADPVATKQQVSESDMYTPAIKCILLYGINLIYCIHKMCLGVSEKEYR